jgi:hypothetical protein
VLTRADGTRLQIVRGKRPGAWIDGRAADVTALSHAALLRARRLELGIAPIGNATPFPPAN